MERLKTIMIAVLVTVLLMGASTVDKRKQGPDQPIAAEVFPQLSWASGVSTADTDTLRNVNMLVERVDVITSNSTNAITYTVTVTDENGSTIISESGLAENTNHVLLATKATPDFDAIPVFTTLYGELTVSVTPSGDPGASGATVDVILVGP